MASLTPAQEEYFRILESLHPSEDLQRSIHVAKEELQENPHDSHVVRGLTRVTGFTRNEK